MLDYLADRGILTVRDLIPIAEEVLGTVIDENRYEEGYLDTPIAQLKVSADPFAMPLSGMDPEEKLATVAKRLLRETRAKHHV